MGNDFGLTESLFSHVGSGLFVFATDNLRFAPYDRGLTLCLKAFSLRSLGVVGNAGPPTSRPGGLDLKRWVRAEFISVR
jgi:hypothetical protein